MSRPNEQAPRLEQARRRGLSRLVAGIGAIFVVLLLAFFTLVAATTPTTLAEETFVTPFGDRIAARIAERGDRITGHLLVSGPGRPNDAAMEIEFAPTPGQPRTARIDYDADRSRVLLRVNDSRIDIDVALGGVGVGFRPIVQPRPQSGP